MLGYHQLSFLLYNVLSFQAAFATSQRMFPKEYAYRGDSVTRSERASANCMNYPPIHTMSDAKSEQYIHCNGTQLILSDSEVGLLQQQYEPSYYYEWSVESGLRQLLFIFPTRVSLTNITLHYYSSSKRGLPQLGFYAVPDDFDVWDAASGSDLVSRDAVQPGVNPIGHTKVSIKFNFTTMKVLMVKAASTFKFALGEVEFHKYNDLTEEPSTTAKMPQTSTSAMTTTATQNEHSDLASANAEDTTSKEDENYPTSSIIIDAESTTTMVSSLPTVTIGVVAAITILLIAVVGLTVVIFAKKLMKSKLEQNSPYSVFNRSEATQHQQPQLVDDFNDTYDQIKLSPLTGQAEFVSNIESENVRNISQQQHDNHPTHPHMASNQTSFNETSTTSPEQPTYAVINKKKKKAVKETASTKKTDIHDETEAASTQGGHVKTKKGLEEKGTNMHTPSKEVESLEELYTAVIKKPKDSAAKKEEPPPIPAHTVEELYTAVNKIPKVSAATNKEEEAPPIPAHTVEELYTAVNKTPKGEVADNEEEAPPIPPHTVEELYTAVNKTPKGNAPDNEEEAPPIPPYTAGEM